MLFLELFHSNGSFYYMPVSGWYSFLTHRLHLKKIIQSNENKNENENENENESNSKRVVYEVVNIPTRGNADGSVVKSEFIITENGIVFQ